jgi:hypothetical protein
MVFFSGDWGVCEFFPQPPPELSNMIHLTFWGLKTHRRGMFLDRGPCYNPDKDIVLPPIQVGDRESVSEWRRLPAAGVVPKPVPCLGTPSRAC